MLKTILNLGHLKFEFVLGFRYQNLVFSVVICIQKENSSALPMRDGGDRKIERMFSILNVYCQKFFPTPKRVERYVERYNEDFGNLTFREVPRWE